MAQASAIVINDGQTTPVAVTFNPESITPALSRFADRVSGIATAFRRMNVSTVFAQGQSKVNKSQLTLEIPITATVDGTLTTLRTLRAKVEYILPDGSTDAERKDLHAFTINALGNTLVRGAMRDLDPLY